MAGSRANFAALVDGLGVYSDSARVKREWRSGCVAWLAAHVALCVDDISRAIREYRTLSPMSSPLTFFQGSDVFQETLATLNGTLPMVYRNATYYIPIELFFPRDYPASAPVVYVRPARDMIIPSRHPMVASDGLVQIAYGEAWQRDTHNLSDFLAMLSAVRPASSWLSADGLWREKIFASGERDDAYLGTGLERDGVGP
eukprot:scaffold2659_cov275-Pinguiococcus_pyrenoidosus.AAC.4